MRIRYDYLTSTMEAFFDAYLNAPETITRSMLRRAMEEASAITGHDVTTEDGYWHVHAYLSTQLGVYVNIPFDGIFECHEDLHRDDWTTDYCEGWDTMDDRCDCGRARVHWNGEYAEEMDD